MALLESKLHQLAKQLQPIAVLCIGSAFSLLIATNIRCHGALLLAAYVDDSAAAELPAAGVRWLGATPGAVTYLLVPLFAGTVDHFKLAYRLCALAGSFAILAGSIGSAVLAGDNPGGQLIITDALVSGCGASLVLSTVILAIDDGFPAASGTRVLATTLCQGVAYATFFLVNAHAALVRQFGWRAAFYVYGTTSAGLGLLAALTFSRPPTPRRRYSPQRHHVTGEDDDDQDDAVIKAGDSIIDDIHDERDWKARLLSLSQAEMNSSRTCLLWLLERLLAALVTDGTFQLLLSLSSIASNPLLLQPATATPSSPRPATAILPALVFSVGSTASYLAGAAMGSLLPGRLLLVYMAGALVNVCALTGWAAVLGSSSSFARNAELIFVWSCGFGVGGVNTFAYAASEEATGIAARSIFPYTKLANGVSIALMQIAHGTVASSGHLQPHHLLLALVLLSMAQFAALVLIRRLHSQRSYWQQLRSQLPDQ